MVSLISILSPDFAGLIAHGTNNMYEGFTGRQGILRDGYKTVFGESKYSYATVDLTMTALTLTQTVKERMVISGAVTTFEKIRAYENMSKFALGFEAFNTLNTIYGGVKDD